MKIKEIVKHLQEGNTLQNGKKQLRYCENSFAYIVDGVKTISIITALKMFSDE